jgi:hypothetical protein
MKKLFTFGSGILLVTILFFAEVNVSSCTKETVTTIHDTTLITSYPINGLWVGTATTTPVAINTPYYFSLSIYPDGTLSYKSVSAASTFFANGTWSLVGTTFSFSVITVNVPGGPQLTQTGTATYNSTNGTLTNGTVANVPAGSSAVWSMSRVN